MGDGIDLSGYIDPGSFGGSDTIDFGSMLDQLSQGAGGIDPSLLALLNNDSMSQLSLPSEQDPYSNMTQFAGQGQQGAPGGSSLFSNLASLFQGAGGARNLLGLLLGGAGAAAPLIGAVASGGRGPTTTTTNQGTTQQNQTQSASSRPVLTPQALQTVSAIQSLLGAMNPHMAQQGGSLLNQLMRR